MGRFKVVVEKHADGYVAYPLGLKGVVVGEGDTYEEALADVKSAIRFHRETFGQDVLDSKSPALEVFVAETGVAIRQRNSLSIPSRRELSKLLRLRDFASFVTESTRIGAVQNHRL